MARHGRGHGPARPARGGEAAPGEGGRVQHEEVVEKVQRGLVPAAEERQSAVRQRGELGAGARAGDGGAERRVGGVGPGEGGGVEVVEVVEVACRLVTKGAGL